ncbi:unnamed protein product [Lactuca saligna]|uniref:Uncharacterized protein n=1 Tax=Lactuca saligna TaxID=75948 RepID=A0AA35YSF7_LACSI|nr:unnamed protein product [Lactuca saligna]
MSTIQRNYQDHSAFIFLMCLYCGRCKTLILQCESDELLVFNVAASNAVKSSGLVAIVNHSSAYTDIAYSDSGKLQPSPFWSLPKPDDVTTIFIHESYERSNQMISLLAT